jgi:hypothetical protein
MPTPKFHLGDELEHSFYVTSEGVVLDEYPVVTEDSVTMMLVTIPASAIPGWIVRDLPQWAVGMISR